MKYMQSKMARILISICIAGPGVAVLRLVLGDDPNRAPMPWLTIMVFALSYIVLSSVVKRARKSV